MLPNTHLTSHSRMSGSRRVNISLWISRPLRPFLYSSSIYSCHLFCFCYILTISVLCHVHPCTKCSLNISNFLEEISSLPLLLFSSVSLHYSFKEAFLSLLVIVRNSVFSWVYPSLSPLPFISLLSSAVYKASSDNQFSFLTFLFLGIGFGHCLLYNLQISVHNSSGTLSSRSNPLNLFITSTV